MTERTRAVFLSYASQDAEAAGRIAAALRAAGMEVWFDQSALRGGDAWDQLIRRQIKSCALFIAVVSRHTHERAEGYFRLEWKLAVDRSHLIATDKAFLLPVVIDATGDDDERVPDKFREVQWTRLPDGQAPASFAVHVQRLLSGEALPTTRGPRNAAVAAGRVPKSALLAAVATVALAAVGYIAVGRLRSWQSPVFAPPPHSVAVLPFVNLSGDKEQEYFSDGLTEELLNSLAEIRDLQVAARTSSFSFKEHPDIATVARKLNVGAVLEGSVRRSAQTVRVSAQLINTVTGFHIWSKTYDRDLGDVLKLQTEIATAVAEALKITLLGDVSTRIELGGTRNPGAFDAYLRGLKAFQSIRDPRDMPAAIAAYTEAIRLDPNYALALAGRSMALTDYTSMVATGVAIREGFARAEADARQAITLAPELAAAHVALAAVSESGNLDFPQARRAYERAAELAPGNAKVLRVSGQFAAEMGEFDVAIASLRRAVVLDPIATGSHSDLAFALYLARRYGEAATAYAQAISLFPDYEAIYGQRGLVSYALGDPENARLWCERKRDFWSQWCLAVVYVKLGRRADAQAELQKMQVTMGDASAYQYAAIYAQWGDRSKALEWLETAMRLRDPGLEMLKTDPLMDPLRHEPRFQAIERELKFPE